MTKRNCILIWLGDQLQSLIPIPTSDRLARRRHGTPSGAEWAEAKAAFDPKPLSDLSSTHDLPCPQIRMPEPVEAVV